MNKDSCVLSW